MMIGLRESNSNWNVDRTKKMITKPITLVLILLLILIISSPVSATGAGIAPGSRNITMDAGSTIDLYYHGSAFDGSHSDRTFIFIYVVWGDIDPLWFSLTVTAIETYGFGEGWYTIGSIVQGPYWINYYNVDWSAFGIIIKFIVTISVPNDASGTTGLVRIAVGNYHGGVGAVANANINLIIRPNLAPVAIIGDEYETNEGIPITFDASGSTDPDEDELQYRWDLDNDRTWDTDYSTDPTATYTWYDDYTGEVVVDVSDGDLTDSDTTTVTVNNVAPAASIDDMIQPFPDFILPTDVLEFHGSFTDPGTLDTHTIDWDFGDCDSITGTLTPTHAYAEPGTYTATLTVTDDDGGVGTASTDIIVETPAEATQEIFEVIQEMELQHGMNASLSSKLENAIDSMDNDQDNAAVNQLNAFIYQVEAQRGKKLSDEEADELIAAAQWIIDNISGE